MDSGNGLADGPPGLSLSALTTWLDQEHPSLRQGELQASVIVGGRSNLTYRLFGASSPLVLRRPPLGSVLAGSRGHDMVREYRVISALQSSEVPVPEPVALCADASVLGQPFYLMAFVDGVVLDSPEMSPTPATAEHATSLLVDTLVALHSVDPGAVGLANFGWTENFLERQLLRWHQQFESWAGSSETEQRVVAALHDGLPAAGQSSIVHGDYRLTNVLFSHDLAHIKAVVDWEMATLGDPLTDVGLLYCYHSLSGISSVMPDFPAAEGFLSADAMIARYAMATGGDLSSLDWYITFGYLKLSVIAAGIHARFQHGDTVGDGFEVFGGLVQQTLDAARSQLGGF